MPLPLIRAATRCAPVPAALRLARRARRAAIPAAGLFLAPLAAEAHEVWIEPDAWISAPGAPLSARVFNGEFFEGTELAWFPDRFPRAELVTAAQAAVIDGRLGDRPALAAPPLGEGLHIFVVRSGLSRLEYRSLEAFASFASHKGYPDAAAEHLAAGHPEQGFGELYTRFAKALVSVGAGEGADRRTGLEVEITSLANPYLDGAAGGIEVEVTYKGAPRAGGQLEIFERAPGGAVTVFTRITDAQGRATVPVKPGHDYLLDHVVLRAPEPGLAAERQAVWESLWASLTFSVPAR